MVDTRCHPHGLSPRGRGNRSPFILLRHVGGSIPAWAGEPYQYADGNVVFAVYPRVGGGTPTNSEGSIPAWAGEPRVQDIRDPDPFGSIPAWAGEPRSTTWSPTRRRVYPRVGGGTRWCGPNRDADKGLSPRGRGNLPSIGAELHSVRSIPAWAGEPRLCRCRFELRVYPRVGGGTGASNRSEIRSQGLSP